MKEKYSEIELKISFNTPAFLGNAKQEGQWRTPPFKALLRQWWRVVKAANGCDNIDKLRSEEAILFGSATDDKNKELHTVKSKLRLKLLDGWRKGDGKNIINTSTVIHKEVEQNNHRIDADLYLGFGPIEMKREKTIINNQEKYVSKKKIKPYIVPDVSKNTLWIAFPSNYKEELIKTIQLIAWFGTIGSRSRNGWGSIRIESAEFNGNEKIEIKNEIDKEDVCKYYSDDFSRLIKFDCPRKIGKDDKGLLIWKTSSKYKYEDILNDLARIKIAFRTHFTFPDEKPGRLRERHILSYPITNHKFFNNDNLRKPNQLRFKIVKDNDKFYGLIFHLPCKATESFYQEYKKSLEKENNKKGKCKKSKESLNNEFQEFKDNYKSLEKKVWSEIYDFLDNKCDGCKRIK